VPYKQVDYAPPDEADESPSDAAAAEIQHHLSAAGPLGLVRREH